LEVVDKMLDKKVRLWQRVERKINEKMEVKVKDTKTTKTRD
jgi:hypothetical protein